MGNLVLPTTTLKIVTTIPTVFRFRVLITVVEKVSYRCFPIVCQGFQRLSKISKDFPRPWFPIVSNGFIWFFKIFIGAQLLMSKENDPLATAAAAAWAVAAVLMGWD